MRLAGMIRFARDTYRFGRLARSRPSRVQTLRDERLRDVVRHALSAPYFREKYRGIDPQRFELAELPTTTKRELMEHFDDAVTDRTVRRADVEAFVGDTRNLGRLFRGRYAASHTSGSQGQPLVLLQTRRCLEVLFGLTAGRANGYGRPSLWEGLRRLVRPTRLAIVTMRRGFYPSAAAFEFMPALTGGFVGVTRLSAMDADLLDRLNELRPNLLVSYPSVLDWLTLQPRLQLAPGLQQIGCTGEHLTDAARRRLTEKFGVPVVDHYGIGECLFLTDGCLTDGGAHVNADWAVLEVVDRHNRPVPAGQPGEKILVTNLSNTIQPIIRYEVGDVVTLADRPCRCGSRLPWIERVDGRSADVFWTGDGRMVTGLVFKHAVQCLHQMREWQAVQVRRDHVELRVELLPGMRIGEQAVDRLLRQKLAELGLPADVSVTARVVPSLGPDPVTGKFRRMISLVGESAVPDTRAA